MSSYGELLREGAEVLAKAGVEEARADAERLLMDLLDVSRSFLFLHRNGEAPAPVEERFREGLIRRSEGEPVQYITGVQEFMGLPFRVSPAVLIPRLDTEVLVERALRIAGEKEGPQKILDMCCGSGAIAVSVARALPEAEVTACDISEEALRMTAENAARSGVAERVRTLRTDMFAAPEEGVLPAEPLPADFDMILCNPPYIASGVIPTLSREVKDYEPLLALDGGGDGLRFYRILAAEAGAHLRRGGALVMEIGFDQDSAVRRLLEDAGDYRGIGSQKDLAGLDRVIFCFKK